MLFGVVHQSDGLRLCWLSNVEYHVDIVNSNEQGPAYTTQRYSHKYQYHEMARC